MAVDPKIIHKAKLMYLAYDKADPTKHIYSIRDIAKKFKVSPSTVHRWIEAQDDNGNTWNDLWNASYNKKTEHNVQNGTENGTKTEQETEQKNNRKSKDNIKIADKDNITKLPQNIKDIISEKSKRFQDYAKIEEMLIAILKKHSFDVIKKVQDNPKKELKLKPQEINVIINALKTVSTNINSIQDNENNNINNIPEITLVKRYDIPTKKENNA